jgi:hypothetical protein
MTLRSTQRMRDSTCNVLTLIFGWTAGAGDDDCHYDSAANDYDGDDDGAAGSVNSPLCAHHSRFSASRVVHDCAGRTASTVTCRHSVQFCGNKTQVTVQRVAGSPPG